MFKGSPKNTFLSGFFWHLGRKCANLVPYLLLFLLVVISGFIKGCTGG